MFPDLHMHRHRGLFHVFFGGGGGGGGEDTQVNPHSTNAYPLCLPPVDFCVSFRPEIFPNMIYPL